MSQKKSGGRKSRKRFLKDVGDEKSFKLIDGSELRSLLDLANTLDAMSDDVFYYHVTNDRNDFANWVRGVFEDEDLASNVENSNGRMECQVCVLKHLVNNLK